MPTIDTAIISQWTWQRTNSLLVNAFACRIQWYITCEIRVPMLSHILHAHKLIYCYNIILFSQNICVRVISVSVLWSRCGSVRDADDPCSGIRCVDNSFAQLLYNDNNINHVTMINHFISTEQFNCLSRCSYILQNRLINITLVYRANISLLVYSSTCISL